MKRSWDGIDVKKSSRPKRSIDLNGEAKSDDPQMCGAYASHIYAYLRSMEREARRRPSSDYIEKVQRNMTVNLRGTIVNWLVAIADDFNLQPQTLYLTVSYMDRFLSVNYIYRERLTLLGVSSMLIAWKYEEGTSEHSYARVEKLRRIECTCTRDELLQMESVVLKTLRFELGNPTTKTFLQHFIRIAQGNNESHNMQFEFLCCYIAELSLLDYACLKFLPSLVAASAIFLSRFTLQPNQHPWNSALQQYSGYRAADLKECVLFIHALQLGRRCTTLDAIREKYQQHKFKCVSTLTSLPQVPESFFQDIKDEIWID